MRGVKRTKRMLAAGIGLAALLLLSGCNEGPWVFTSEQAREHLENRYPGEKIEMKAQGLNTWLCWFEDLPEATFHVEMVTWGGDPVPYYHNGLGSNAPDAVWTYYLDTYRKEGGSLDAWEIGKAKWADESCMSKEYTSMAQAREAAEQLQAFYDWTEDRPHREFLAKGRYYYLFADALPWQTSLSDKIDVCTQGPEDSLYEMLVRLDMPVEGTPEHFWFTGVDGAEYEFSYDFHREAHSKEDETHIIWYFLRNGYMVDTSHESAWYLSWWDYGPLLRLDMGQHYQIDENHFRWDTIPELITGLSFRRSTS